MKPVLKAPGTMLLKLRYDEPLSSFAFSFNLRRYSKEYMRECCVIEPKWLAELAPRFFKLCDPRHISKRKRMERLEPLYDRFNDPQAWRLSKRRA